MLHYPTDKQTTNDKLRFLVALQEKLRIAHNEEKDNKQKKYYWKPRILEVSGALAELRNDLPEKQEHDETRYNRPDILKTISKEEIDSVDINSISTANLKELPDPYEDFSSGYTETDPNSDITISTTNLTIDSMIMDVDAYVYKDFTAGHFGDTVDHDFECKVTGRTVASYSVGTVWALTNVVNDGYYWYANNSQAVHCWFYWTTTPVYRLYLRDCENGGTDQDFYTCLVNTWYYCTASRNATSMSILIYSDSGRTSLLDTITVTLAAGRTYRYFMACNSYDIGTTATMSWVSDYYDLHEASSSSSMSSISSSSRSSISSSSKSSSSKSSSSKSSSSKSSSSRSSSSRSSRSSSSKSSSSVSSSSKSSSSKSSGGSSSSKSSASSGSSASSASSAAPSWVIHVVGLCDAVKDCCTEELCDCCCPTCPTNCDECAVSYVTLGGLTGDCACIHGTYPMTYPYDCYWYYQSGWPFVCTGMFGISLFCDNGLWYLAVSGASFVELSWNPVWISEGRVGVGGCPPLGDYTMILIDAGGCTCCTGLTATIM